VEARGSAWKREEARGSARKRGEARGSAGEREGARESVGSTGDREIFLRTLFAQLNRDSRDNPRFYVSMEYGAMTTFDYGTFVYIFKLSKFLCAGLNGLGIMVNPTSPYNFTLQWSTVQAIGEMVEARRENEQAAMEDDYIPHQRGGKRRGIGKIHRFPVQKKRYVGQKKLGLDISLAKNKLNLQIGY
jgi:hypothetical protein